MEETGLAKTQESKPTQRRRGRKRTPTPDNGLKSPIANAVGQSLEEVGVIVSSVRAGCDAVAEDAAEQMIDTIADIPNETLAKFGEKAEAHIGDAQRFREIGEGIAANIRTVFGAV